MKIIKTSNVDFQIAWEKILARSSDIDTSVEPVVRDILHKIRTEKDAGLQEATKRFDQHELPLAVSTQEINRAIKELPQEALKSLEKAASRIREFHQEQKKRLPASYSWNQKKNGVMTGEKITPLERVGVYVPGGLAAYPSTVLMNSIPAQVAGVKEIIMVSPWPRGVSSPATLAAAHLIGIKKIFRVGGAQAIAALAHGTESIPAVDKIVGPGNIYVATAKRLVFGKVGIDMIAGPTEIAIVADNTANPDFIASDLLSQAEHDPRASAILITSSESLAQKVTQSLEKQKITLERSDILGLALNQNGLIIITKNLDESLKLANEIATEHLELHVKNPKTALSKIKNAGAIFLGHLTPVAFGDYLAGPNHVLPTSRTARFSSPLGVNDFIKRSSVIEFSKKSLRELGPDVVRLAKLEGLTAHASSVSIRIQKGIS